MEGSSSFIAFPPYEEYKRGVAKYYTGLETLITKLNARLWWMALNY